MRVVIARSFLRMQVATQRPDRARRTVRFGTIRWSLAAVVAGSMPIVGCAHGPPKRVNGTGATGASVATGSRNAGELIHADFEARSPGQYTQAMVSRDFGAAASWNNGLDAGRATIVNQDGNSFLRVSYPANQYGPTQGGVQFKVPLGGSHKELYLSYRLRFGSGFQFVGGKLPGLVGGTAPTGCISDNGGFSARGMWRPDGVAVQYLYYPEKKNRCGDDFSYVSGGGTLVFVPGTWQTIEHRIVMNTPEKHNGVLQAWVDGALVPDQNQFYYRVPGATFMIDALYFSTFFGGSDSTWAPATDQTVDYDDFIVSSRPITH
jgi:hypothetical protein